MSLTYITHITEAAQVLSPGEHHMLYYTIGNMCMQYQQFALYLLNMIQTNLWLESSVEADKAELVEQQGSLKVGIQDTLVFLICLMSWGGRLFLKGDRRLD